jgi:hypothetical protein
MDANRAWVVMAGLVAFALLVLWVGPCIGFDPAVTGAIVGALMGGVGVLLGVTLDRSARRADEQRAEEGKRQRLKTLITAELVNVAVGAIDAHRIMTAAIDAINAGATAGAFDVRRYMPRELAFASNAGGDLLALSDREIDVLATVMSNLQITRGSIADLATVSRALNLMDAVSLKNQFANDLENLAAAFEQFAPTRKFQMPGADTAELATVLLRREASRAAKS